MKSQNENQAWFVYMIECVNSSLYTGIAKNVEKRFQMHTKGKGAKYTKIHKPIRIVYTEKMANHSEALKREREIKKLSKKQKLLLCSNTE